LAALAKRAYGLPGKVECSLWDNNVNISYLLRAGGDRFFLRVYKPGWRSRKAVEFELRMLLHLRLRNVPVSWPLTALDGRLFQEIALPDGPACVALFTEARGSAKGGSFDVMVPLAGRTLAQMHEGMDSFGGRPVLPAFDARGLAELSLRRLATHRESFGTEWDWLRRRAGEIRRLLERLPRTGPGYGLVHGDCHRENMHYEQAMNCMTLFDFDTCTWGWRIYDLATLLWSGRQGVDLRKLAKCLAQGYSQVRPLEDWEWRALPLMVAARHLSWMGFHGALAYRLSAKLIEPERQRSKLFLLKDWHSGKLSKSMGLG
jgi:Ser/Thr protein kinase RdoA (MazF antagonist)